VTERTNLEPEVTTTDTELVRQDSLWKIRWTLFRRSFKANWRLFRANPIGIIGLLIIAFWALMALAPAILMGTGLWQPNVYDPVTGLEPNPPTKTYTVVNQITDPETEIDFKRVLLDNRIPNDVTVGETVDVPLQPAPPTARHLLGTDPLGRDILSQLMHGARAAFFLGILAATVTVLIATIVGSVSAYFGGAIDGLFMRLADLFIMIPALAILIVIGAIFEFRLWHLAVVIGLLSGFGGTAIVLKSQALAVKVKPFIDAARVAGGSNSHIIVSHVIPNVMPLSFLYMMFTVTGAIQSEAVLSFLGLLNVRTSWGLMIQLANNQGYLLQGTEYWWLLFPAGLAVTLLAAAFFLVGRAMDEVVNPRLRRR
jgi:peptide/nickel transport system permease protein